MADEFMERDNEETNDEFSEALLSTSLYPVSTRCGSYERSDSAL